MMFGYFFLGFTSFMRRGKSSLNYENFLSLKEYEKNDKTMLKQFQ